MKRSSSLSHRVLAILAMVLVLVPAARARDSAAPDTLAWINGEPITSEDVDALVLASHQGRDMSAMSSIELPNFLKKAVNDRLLVQDAFAMGMDEEPSVQEAADALMDREAIRAFVSDRFDPPVEADSLAMREYFEKYYWRVHLRQISVRTRAEADSLRRAVLGGADMDSLARARSLDSNSIRGGLHNLKYWGDVEDVLRRAVYNVDTGSLSEVFPFREAFAFLRVEERGDLDREAFPEKEARIRSIILDRQRKEAWERFLDELDALTPVGTVDATMAAIRADSNQVFKGEFLRRQPEPAMSLGGRPVLTGTELRREISHTAMTRADAPFDSILHDAVATLRKEVLLEHHARSAGFYEDESLLEKRRRVMEQSLVENYLQEMIVPRIVFNRDEFQEYYESNSEAFRGPEEVRLDMVVIEERDRADEMSARLSEGADFDFLRSQYLGTEGDGAGSVRWVAANVFASSIQEELEGMEPGSCSLPVETRGGWLIFKLLGRRAGAVKPIADVEMQIREVMFQRKFTELLDEHLELLRERSEIRMNQEAIDEYFGEGS